MLSHLVMKTTHSFSHWRLDLMDVHMHACYAYKKLHFVSCLYLQYSTVVS